MNRRHEQAAHQITSLYNGVAQRMFVRALVLTEGDRGGAQDLVQEVFHDAIKRWDQVGSWSLSRQERWLFRVLHNKAIDRWRQGRRIEPLPPADLLAHPGDVHHDAMDRIAAERAWKVIQEMPPARHHVACLRWIAGWEVSDIAVRLGIQPSTVRVHLKHARDILRAEIGPDVPYLDDLDCGETIREEGGTAS